MKKILATLTAVGILALSGQSLAVDKSNTGCGLGYMIFKDYKDSVLTEVLAVTTNNILWNQTLGITSGTSECKRPSEFVKNDRLFKFVSENMDQLASDIASGNGETLETVAELMNIPEDKRDVFYSKAQENFDKIYSSKNVQSADVIDQLAKIANKVING
jgi:hypothetical protein